MNSLSHGSYHIKNVNFPSDCWFSLEFYYTVYSNYFFYIFVISFYDDQHKIRLKKNKFFSLFIFRYIIIWILLRFLFGNSVVEYWKSYCRYRRFSRFKSYDLFFSFLLFLLLDSQLSSVEGIRAFGRRPSCVRGENETKSEGKALSMLHTHTFTVRAHSRMKLCMGYLGEILIRKMCTVT